MLGLSGAIHKLRGVPNRQKYIWADWDESLADKDPEYFHNAPLKADQHANLTAIASEVGHFFVMTASGQDRVLNFLKQHGGVPHNVSLASDSGHWYLHQVASEDAESVILPIPGYDGKSLTKVLNALNGIMTVIGDEFPADPVMLVDRRKLCGALVYQFPGDDQSEMFTRFKARIEELKAGLDPEVGSCIKFDAKHKLVNHPVRGLETHGYVDLKPIGMSKGNTIEQLFNKHPEWFPHAVEPGHVDSYHIVIGDSAPDLEMMKAVSARFGRENVINISVGPALRKLAPELIDVEFLGNGHTPVEMCHTFLGDLVPLPVLKSDPYAASRDQARAHFESHNHASYPQAVERPATVRAAAVALPAYVPGGDKA